MKKRIQNRQKSSINIHFKSKFEMHNIDNERIKSNRGIEDSQYVNDINDLYNYYATLQLHIL
jgi:hypothetical protein